MLIVADGLKLPYVLTKTHKITPMAEAFAN